MDVSERTFSYHGLWVAYTPAVAVLWEYRTAPDGERSRTMCAMHIYGTVDSVSARLIPHSLIAAADPADYPRWQARPTGGAGDDGNDIYELVPLAHGEPPQWSREFTDWDAWPTPTDSQVGQAWRALPGPAGTALDLVFDPRQPGEEVEAFYARVAAAYRALATINRKPTTSLAARAGVSKQTAARWIHEARRRGHLEQTTRGRVNR